jgi:glycosyltransferase involved in cell wall biosynthesis
VVVLTHNQGVAGSCPAGPTDNQAVTATFFRWLFYSQRIRKEITPLINILTRSHERPEEFKKCVRSIRAQNYKKIHCIVSVHDDQTEIESRKTLEQFKLSHEIIRVNHNGVPYNWNLFCNDLKERVKQGWFFYLDSDDWLYNSHNLNGLSPYLKDPGVGVICQYYRGRKAKPANLIIRKDGTVDPESIIKGKIGGSAIFLHASQKNLADWQPKRAADYDFIKEVAAKIPLKFVPIPIVQAGNSGRHGS